MEPIWERIPSKLPFQGPKRKPSNPKPQSGTPNVKSPFGNSLSQSGATKGALSVEYGGLNSYQYYFGVPYNKRKKYEGP